MQAKFRLQCQRSVPFPCTKGWALVAMQCSFAQDQESDTPSVLVKLLLFTIVIRLPSDFIKGGRTAACTPAISTAPGYEGESC